MKNTDFLEPYQYCIYADYHDSVVKVFYTSNGELYTKQHNNHPVCLFAFDEDVIPEDASFKEMKFSDFYKLVVDSGYEHLSHFSEGGMMYGFHTDAYKRFTKEALDELLTDLPEEKIRDYDFLYSKSFVPYKSRIDYDVIYQKVLDWIQKKRYITHLDLIYELELGYNQSKIIISNLIQDGIISSTIDHKNRYWVISGTLN